MVIAPVLLVEHHVLFCSSYSPSGAFPSACHIWVRANFDQSFLEVRGARVCQKILPYVPIAPSHYSQQFLAANTGWTMWLLYVVAAAVFIWAVLVLHVCSSFHWCLPANLVFCKAGVVDLPGRQVF